MVSKIEFCKFSPIEREHQSKMYVKQVERTRNLKLEIIARFHFSVLRATKLDHS